jgi:protein-S-isoprenylcysteine O-methyltransferase Ste14
MSKTAIFFLLVIAPIFALALAWLGLLTIPSNLIGWFLLLVGLAYSVGVVVAFTLRRIRLFDKGVSITYSQEERGDRSFWFIALGMMAVFYLSPIEYLCFLSFHQQRSPRDLSGFALILLGTALLVWARRTLGSGYTGHASVKQTQPLVRNGPYQWIRHPAYLGYLLMVLGITLGYWSIAGLVSMLVILVPSMIFRINVEEEMLSKHFGKVHKIYSKKTKRLIPGIW